MRPTQLRTFGCEGYINIPKSRRHGTVGAKAIKAYMIGYAKNVRAWRMWCPTLDPPTIKIARNVAFNEGCTMGMSWIEITKKVELMTEKVIHPTKKRGMVELNTRFDLQKQVLLPKGYLRSNLNDSFNHSFKDPVKQARKQLKKKQKRAELRSFELPFSDL